LLSRYELRPQAPKQPRSGSRRWLRLLAGLTLIVVVLSIGAALWFTLDADALPAAVDFARAVFGPGAVAQVESLVFGVQDDLRQARYRTAGTTADLQWAAPATQPASPLAAPVPAAQTRSASPSDSASAQVAAPGSDQTLSWAPYVLSPSGAPLLERALVSPDPDRPYVQAALIRIDLSHTSLHMAAGTVEPASAANAARPGTIPAKVRNSGALIAAFNGGFKAANGHYGMAVDNTTLLRPQDGLATLAFYRDGSLRMGVWGQDITQTPDLVAFRQNCPLLIDHGALTDETATPTQGLWGKTVGNKVATWRSGLGLSADGQTLIYAVGDGLTVPALAEALREGGADRAMQLDINSFWTRFVTFSPGPNGTLQAQKLLDGMKGDSRQFIAPDSRDFFYLTRQP
jgi:hypothetical protein